MVTQRIAGSIEFFFRLTPFNFKFSDSCNMLSSQIYALAVLAASTTAQMVTSTSSTASSAPTAVTGCHSHGDDEFFCIAGNAEWEVTSPELNAESLPDSFEDCHSHGEEL